MLYNEAWDKPTKADPFELGTLIAWLEKQPADGAYDYRECDECMFWHYFKSHGLPLSSVGPGYYRLSPNICQTHDLPEHFEDIAWQSPWTYGAALARARAAARS